MATTIEQLVEQAMTLPSESRALLADLLVESLEGDDLGRIEQLWISEQNAGGMKYAPEKSRPFPVKKLCVRCATPFGDEI